MLRKQSDVDEETLLKGPETFDEFREKHIMQPIEQYSVVDNKGSVGQSTVDVLTTALSEAYVSIDLPTPFEKRHSSMQQIKVTDS